MKGPDSWYEVSCPTGSYYTPSRRLAHRYARLNQGKIVQVTETRCPIPTLPGPRRGRPPKRKAHDAA